MISSILARELDKPINILWIQSNNPYFEKFIKTLGFSLFSLDQIYIGSYVPDVIISNNKSYQLDSLIDLAIYHHCGLIFVDHENKSDMIDIKKFQEKITILPNKLQIAISDNISQSWNNIHDIILDFDKKESVSKWSNLILNFTKRIFIYA